MRLPYLAALLILSLNPALAYAQDDGEIDEMPEVDPALDEDSEGGEAQAPNAGPIVTKDVEDVSLFGARRGFFVSGDFGLYFRFGGTNTNNQLLPSRSTSNIQPVYGIIAGYDLFDTDSFALSGGLRFAMLLNGGSGTVTAEAMASADPNTVPNDYSIIQTGVAFTGSIRLAERVGLVLGLDGALALLNPDPLAPAATGPGVNGALPDSGGLGLGGIAALGVGWELYTLLDGFTIGSMLRFTALFLGSEFVPGLAIEVLNFKYTF